jgi:chorismate dehydratase
VVVGKVPYLNAEPFHLHLADTGCRVVDVTPRQLGERAEKGEIDAGLMAVADFFRLEDRFSLLGPYCIAARRDVHSVLLVSNRPARALHDADVALTEESSTSVLLLRLLLEQAFGVRTPRYVRGTAAAADARLVIGDEALRLRAGGFAGYSYVVDLAREWWEWTGLPMVFAAWVVRTTAPLREKAALREAIESSLTGARDAEQEIAERRAPALGMTSDAVVAYLRNLTYRLGDDEAKGLATFRSRVETLHVPGIPVALGR